MKNKSVFKIAFISVLIFIIVATYFWYLYFKNGIGKSLSNNIRLEIANNGGINYINARYNDPDDKIPVYYFRVNNNSNNNIEYDILFEKTSVSDGCTESTIFSSDELNYEIKKNDRIVKSGLVSDIKNGVIYSSTVTGNTKDNYALRVFLNEKAEEKYQNHYHYIINIREK